MKGRRHWHIYMANTPVPITRWTPRGAIAAKRKVLSSWANQIMGVLTCECFDPRCEKARKQ